VNNLSRFVNDFRYIFKRLWWVSDQGKKEKPEQVFLLRMMGQMLNCACPS